MLEMEAQGPSAGARPGLPRPVRPGPLPAPDRDVLDSARARLAPARTRPPSHAGTAANQRAPPPAISPARSMTCARPARWRSRPARPGHLPGRAARYRGGPGPAEQRAAVCGPAGSQPARAGPAGRDELGPDRGHYRRPGGRGQGPPVGYAAAARSPGELAKAPRRRLDCRAEEWAPPTGLRSAERGTSDKRGGKEVGPKPPEAQGSRAGPGQPGRLSGRRPGPARLIGRLSQPVSGS